MSISLSELAQRSPPSILDEMSDRSFKAAKSSPDGARLGAAKVTVRREGGRGSKGEKEERKCE